MALNFRVSEEQIEGFWIVSSVAAPLPNHGNNMYAKTTGNGAVYDSIVLLRTQSCQQYGGGHAWVVMQGPVVLGWFSHGCLCLFYFLLLCHLYIVLPFFMSLCKQRSPASMALVWGRLDCTLQEQASFFCGRTAGIIDRYLYSETRTIFESVRT